MACYAPSSESLLRQTSRQSSSGDVFSDELEFLQNVYFDDLTYKSCDQGSHILQFRVTPSTGDDKEKQYVYLVLNITVAKEYPHVVPGCSLGQSRGLSDTHLKSSSAPYVVYIYRHINLEL
ncbi:E3 ubiquitin-protein ligase RNF25-like isoform X2 [Halichondria panicea]|uniref:E3 ubiquitin-protein ligase RNF25-like isoform X2 n=1 Tax=Halichondria panicea TaxID=6063 RepID=UPI00312BC6E4